MFQLIKNPHYDFMGKRRLWLTISAASVVIAVAILFVRGLNMGIEFTGGAEIQLKYAIEPDPGAVRAALDHAGFQKHVVSTISDKERKGENDVYIRIGIQQSGREEDLARRVVNSLRDAAGAVPSDKLDLNAADAASLKSLLEGNPDLTREAVASLADAIAQKRKEAAVIRSADDLASVPGMTPATLSFIKDRTVVGPFAVRGQSYVGPAIGKELVKKAFWAVFLSLGAILVYIGFRFQFYSGAAAVIALVHDTVVTLGLFSLFQFEMSLPVVAAFLTLIGYSVNDTVVCFDRIRENAKSRGTGDFLTLINDSVNQTLSRTIITSGLTWLVCVSLLLFGGETLRPFSFVMVVGIIVGTYSSVFVASPILLYWQRYLERRRKSRRPGTPAAAAASERKAKKVRTSPASR